MAGKRRGNGDGTIVKRNGGGYRAVYTQPDGTRRWLSDRTEKGITAKLREALAARDAGVPAPDGRLTLERWLTMWLEGARGSLRPRTWHRYEQYCRVHLIPALGRVKLYKLDGDRIDRFYTAKRDTGLSARTILHLHRTLHRALAVAVRRKKLAYNPCDQVDAPYVPRTEPRTLTAREAGQLIATARGDRLEALYTLALHTGARQGELLALRWADVDFASGYLTIRGTLQRVPGRGFEVREPKTRRSIRRIALPPTVVDALRAHKARQEAERAARGPAWDGALALVFTNEVGRPIEPQNLVRRSFRPLLRRAGLPAVRFHDLRHTAASVLLAHGEGPLVVAQRLGHASVTTTMGVYGHVQPGQDEHAALTLEAAYAV